MSLVVDTSAWVAILFREPERDTYTRMLVGADQVLVSGVTLVEAGIVVASRLGPAGSERLAALFRELQVRTVAFDADQARLSVEAFQRFGKGRHRAALNLGDCCSYAAARGLNLPLLFKGDDFGHTDIVPAAP